MCSSDLVALLGVLIGYIAAMYISKVSPSVVNVLKTIVLLYVLISIPLSSLFKRRLADFNKNSSSSNSKDAVKKEIYINYEVYGIHNGILSFCVYKTSTSGSAYFDEDFYNIDVNKNKEITLKDVLGPEYMSIADKSIKSQIEERSKMPELYNWGSSKNSSTSGTV